MRLVEREAVPARASACAQRVLAQRARGRITARLRIAPSVCQSCSDGRDVVECRLEVVRYARRRAAAAAASSSCLGRRGEVKDVPRPAPSFVPRWRFHAGPSAVERHRAHAGLAPRLRIGASTPVRTTHIGPVTSRFARIHFLCCVPGPIHADRLRPICIVGVIFQTGH
jgi:hypothetical protein